MDESFNRLKKQLREMFRSDDKDLDFGVYRLMKQKNEEIDAFVEKELSVLVKTGILNIRKEFGEDIEKELSELRKTLTEAGVSLEDSKKYQDLLAKKKEIGTIGDITDEIYKHLVNFFSRYYQDGDFISQFYFKEGTYLIPYDGSEVDLHWVTKDMYYIKTSERYSRFSFEANGRTVLLRVVKVEEKKGNQKGGMTCFMLSEENPIEDDGELKVNFERVFVTDELKELGKNQAEIQKALNLQAISKILETVGEIEGLEGILNKFQRKYKEDYFIHKNLGGFLRGQLNFYLNQEVVHVDDYIDDKGNFSENRKIVAKVFKDVSKNIIEKLDALENLKKKVWEKKKFILESHYVITLDKISEFCGENFLEEIVPEILSNKTQISEWKALFGIEVKGKDDLKINGKWRKLPLDTKNFSNSFKWRILGQIEGLDEKLDGILIHSENWQALNLLQEKYRERVTCIHIDPPYNTETSGFLYKNNYRHSSWLSLMSQCVESSAKVLSLEGVFQCHIDENEYEVLFVMLDRFGLPSRGTIIWDKKNPMLGRQGIATQHEYILWRSKFSGPVYMRNSAVLSIIEHAKRFIELSGGVNDDSRREFSRWIISQTDLTGGEKAYRLLEDDGRVFRGVAMGAPEYRSDPKFHIPLIHPKTKKPCPIPTNGWSRTPETLKKMIDDDEILWGEDHSTQPQKKVYLDSDSKRQLSSVIKDAKSGKYFLDGMDLFFPYCHPVSLYEQLIGATMNDASVNLDFFAGSGTTGHAVISLNKEDKGKRKFILVEMGDYFHTVLNPRIKKVLYSLNWKDGKPQDMDSIGGFFKYHEMEQYEDALENVVFKQMDLNRFYDQKGDVLKYMLQNGIDKGKSGNFLGVDTEDKHLDLKIKVLNESGGSDLKIDGATTEKTVDLIETFIYLMGLDVDKMEKLEDNGAEYFVVKGRYKGEKAIAIWRPPCRDDEEKKAAGKFMDKLLEDKYKEVFISCDSLVSQNYRNIYDEMRKRLW